MKRKIALLLASVMTVSLMPMNAFAASTNSFTKTPQTVPEDTVLYEEGIKGFTGPVDPDQNDNDYPAGTRVTDFTNPLFTDGTQLILAKRDLPRNVNGIGGGFDYAMEGSNLVLKPNGDTIIKAGEKFTVSIDNAEWFFRAQTNAEVIPGKPVGSAELDALKASSTPPTAYTLAQKFTAMMRYVFLGEDPDDASLVPTEQLATTKISPSAIKKLLAATGASKAVSEAAAEVVVSGSATDVIGSAVGDNPVLDAWIADLANRANSTMDFSDPIDPEYAITYDMNQGLWFPKTNSSSAKDDDRRAGIYFRMNRGPLESWSTGSQQIPYTLEISSLDTKRAVITIDGAPGEVYSQNKVAVAGEGNMTALVLPLVTKTSDSNDVKLTVTSDLAGVSTGTYVYGVSSGGKTITSVKDPQTANDEFFLNKLIIKESRLRSIANDGFGSVRIKAPVGFHWTNVDKATVSTDLGLAWGPRTPGASGITGLGNRFVGDGIDDVIHDLYWYRNGEFSKADIDQLTKASERRDMSLRIPGNHDYALGYDIDEGSHSNRVTTGNQYHNTNDRDHYTEDDSIIVLSVQNMIPSSKVTGSLYIEGLKLVADEDAPFGDIKCEIENFTEDDLIGTSPQTFVAGTRSQWDISLTADKTPELIAGRYPAMDSPVFDAQTKTGRVTFKENVPNAWWAGRTTTFTLPAGVKYRKVNIAEVDDVDQGDSLKDENTAYDGYYVNDGKKAGYVKVDGNVMTWEHLSVPRNDDNKRAKIQMDMWLSAAADFAGDVKLTASGTAITKDVTCVIAKVIAPVKVTTTASDIKIGYQYQKTNDITIVENKAGALLKGKTVRVSVSDLVSTDVWFSPDVKVERTDGDLTFKNVSTGASGSAYTGLTNKDSAGQISFDVDKASTKAATIKISNVSVKVDRTVPVTNNRAYKAYVWGNAVAENYDATVNAARDEFSVPGVSANYIAVTTASPDDTGVLSSEVRVTMGERFYTVNGQTMDMDASAYISTKSNSTMVPVRFVANAFGIKDEQIIYDNKNHSVTLIHPTRVVQFVTGSNLMLVNGATTAMYSPDGLPVAAENTNERVYIPFRALGQAFGITVDWDATTNTAIYNKGANKTVSDTITAPVADTTAPATAQ